MTGHLVVEHYGLCAGASGYGPGKQRDADLTQPGMNFALHGSEVHRGQPFKERPRMKILQRSMTLARCLVILTLLIQGRAMAEERAPQSGIQTTMHTFFEALTRVFPWSLNAQQFQDPPHRQKILDALRILAQHAEQLESHGQNVPQSFDFLRRSLAQSAPRCWAALRRRAVPAGALPPAGADGELLCVSLATPESAAI